MKLCHTANQPFGFWRCLALIILIGFSYSTWAASSQIKVDGSRYTYSCGYFSNASATLRFAYRNDALPWGTHVDLIFGFGGTYDSGGNNYRPLEWQKRERAILKAIAPYTWGGQLKRTLFSRSEPPLDTVNFVFRIVLPDDSILYDKGSSSTWGFYQAFIPNEGCVSNPNKLPPPRPLKVEKVVRQ